MSHEALYPQAPPEGLAAISWPPGRPAVSLSQRTTCSWLKTPGFCSYMPGSFCTENVSYHVLFWKVLLTFEDSLRPSFLIHYDIAPSEHRGNGESLGAGAVLLHSSQKHRSWLQLTFHTCQFTFPPFSCLILNNSIIHTNTCANTHTVYMCVCVYA